MCPRHGGYHCGSLSLCHLTQPFPNPKRHGSTLGNQTIYWSTPPNSKWLKHIFLKMYFRNAITHCELGLTVVLVHINKPQFSNSCKQILQLHRPNYYYNISRFSMLSTTVLSQVHNHIQSIIQIHIQNKTLSTNLVRIPNWLNIHSLSQAKRMGRENGN